MQTLGFLTNGGDIYGLIGLHGNQRSMCQNLTSLHSLFTFFSLSLSLVVLVALFVLGFISSLPQLVWEKDLMLNRSD
jgi:hypothetical protein